MHGGMRQSDPMDVSMYWLELVLPTVRYGQRRIEAPSAREAQAITY